MRAILAAAAYLFIFLTIFGAVLLFLGLQRYAGPGPLSADAYFTVEKGSGVAAIAAALERGQIIGNGLLFRAAARVTGQDTAIKAGEYEFPAHISMHDVLGKMAAGDVVQRRYTVPEGYTSWQITQLLKTVDHLTGDVDTVPAEGTLLPETYSYGKDDSRAAQIAQMQKAMSDTLAELWEGRDPSVPLESPEEAVILASIVEKETGIASERARIAGVFINRLKKGIKLQTDPTVIYALTGGKIEDKGKGPLGRRLLTKDLAFDSPYNTYLYAGLPPGPIANPGRAALEAVLHPEENDFIYFVADGTGGHVFSKTLAEHNANVAKWRKIRKKAGQ